MSHLEFPDRKVLLAFVKAKADMNHRDASPFVFVSNHMVRYTTIVCVEECKIFMDKGQQLARPGTRISPTGNGLEALVSFEARLCVFGHTRARENPKTEPVPNNVVQAIERPAGIV